MKEINALEEQLKKSREMLSFEAQLMPEILHGLVALYNDEEDITCFTLKKLYGKLEKCSSRKVF